MSKLILYISNSKFLRILLFIIIFVFITNKVLVKFISPSEDETLAVNLETIKKQNFDVIFMSNSYLFTAYDPLLLNSLTGLSAIHIGTSARRLCYEPFILKQILKEQTPKLVVLDISSTTIVIPDSDHSWFFNNKAISNFSISLEKIKLLNSLIPKNRYDIWLQSFSKTSRILYNLTTERELKYYTHSNSISGKVLGYNIKVTQNPKELNKVKDDFDELYLKEPSNVKTKYNVIDEISISKIHEILDIAEKYSNIEFLFINNVKIDASKEYKPSIDLIKAKTKSYKNVNVLELNTKEAKRDLGLELEDFHDLGHVMLTGSLKVTSYFSDFINKTYDFSIEKDFTPYIFKMKNKNNKTTMKIKDIKLLVGEKYNSDIRVLVDSIPNGYEEVSTIVSIFPKKGFEHLLEDKSIKNKWKSNNAYRKFKNYTKTSNGYVGKLNSWSKLRPNQIDRVEVKFSGPGVLTETKVLSLEKINLLQE